MVTSAGSSSTGKLRVREQWNWCVLVDWVVNLFYCICGGLLEVGSLAKTSWMLGSSGQLSDGQKTSMGWEQDGLGWGKILQGCLPSPPGGWIWLNVLGVVAQRKLFSIVTGKRCMPKVSPGLGWYEQAKSGICLLTVDDSMVVRRSSSHHCSLGSKPLRSQIYSVLSQRNWHVETMGSGITRLCNGDVSWFLQNREFEEVGTVELVCVGGLSRMHGW